MDVADAPIRTNTRENPRTKKIVLMTTFHRWDFDVSREDSSSIDTPDMKER